MIADKDRRLTDQEATIADKDRRLTDQEATIADLIAQRETTLAEREAMIEVSN